QAMLRSARIAHVWMVPALIDMNGPATRAGAAPCSLLPQQAASPSVRTAHEWYSPTPTERKRPAGVTGLAAGGSPRARECGSSHQMVAIDNARATTRSGCRVTR